MHGRGGEQEQRDERGHAHRCGGGARCER
jgi:hypothetical protein